ncbi:hypothetical protein CDD80_2626 [Ophiocordyceps camponoti-rufipedis]|uniref:Large ribosomal subunit protein bL33m n=1 Tax=Ophiocordyceps camponoti-rufipedis TaxID=2004952 RepID=A0A2C5Z525_9HYPO|nr:hypothetical protein CDD80_2626 [Ophiocordyceps camponoti-rufipedis]
MAPIRPALFRPISARECPRVPEKCSLGSHMQRSGHRQAPFAEAASALPFAATLKFGTNRIAMAKKPKSRLVNVRLISMAMTGYFYTTQRARRSAMMALFKYDPIVRKKVLFLEEKQRIR